MKKVFIFSILIINFGCVSVNKNGHERHPTSASQASPKLFMQPAPVFDFECQARTKFKVDSSWYNELFPKIQEFQNIWDKYAYQLITVSEELADKKFVRTEYSVALTLCAWTPMGHPFIVSVRPYLDGPAKADDKIKTPMSMTTFVSMTHHELLHSLVENVEYPDFIESSLMWKKYENEAYNIRVHLHLMAIQKATYVKIGDSELLEKTAKLYQFIGGDYQRAWDIVNLEGAEVFLAELKKYNSTH